MNVQAVTTFSPEGYRLYGARFITSFLKHCPSVPLVAYHESMDVDQIAPTLDWRNLDMDQDRKEFILANQDNPERVSDARFPNHQSIRFCHKVFALTDAAFKQKADWLVWIDADVYFHHPPVWEEALPAGSSLSFLGRLRMYTECGFVGYRISDGRVLRMLEDMRRYYTTGEIFTRPKADWHDSRCFDICRHRSTVPPERWHNLSAHAEGTHVWPQTVLAKWSQHQKGPARKLKTYGGVVR